MKVDCNVLGACITRQQCEVNKAHGTLAGCELCVPKCTITLAEIAVQAGVKLDCAGSAMKLVKYGNISRSRNAQRMQHVLDTLGIAWQQVKGLKPLAAGVVTEVPQTPQTAVAEAPQPEEITMPITESTLPDSTTQGQLKSYTPKELAQLAGVPVYGVYDAKKIHRMGKTPRGGNALAVQNAMKTHGITWEMMVVARSEDAQLDTKRAEATAAPFVSPFVPAVAKLEDSPSLAALLADDEDEEDSAPIAPKAYTLNRPEYVRDFPLTHIPLEALVGEITRRMPRAEVVLR